MTKNIQISFRLTEWQLAQALEVIQALEPNYHPLSLSSMAKLIFQDYLAKMAIVRNQVPQDRVFREIWQLIGTKDRRAEPRRAESRRAESRNSDEQEFAKIMNDKKTSARTPARTHERINQSIAVKSVVTDFSPPKEGGL